jgi:hypothetical protein
MGMKVLPKYKHPLNEGTPAAAIPLAFSQPQALGASDVALRTFERADVLAWSEKLGPSALQWLRQHILRRDRDQVLPAFVRNDHSDQRVASPTLDIIGDDLAS